MAGFDSISTMLPNGAIPSIKPGEYGAAWNGVPDSSASAEALYNKITAIEKAAAGTTKTYTPAASNAVGNPTSHTFLTSNYWQVGDYVFVIGQTRFTATATVISFDVTLPVASNFTEVWHAAGVGGGENPSYPLAIYANPATGRVRFELKPGAGTTYYSYLFIYLVVP